MDNTIPFPVDRAREPGSAELAEPGILVPMPAPFDRNEKTWERIMRGMSVAKALRGGLADAYIARATELREVYEAFVREVREDHAAVVRQIREDCDARVQEVREDHARHADARVGDLLDRHAEERSEWRRDRGDLMENLKDARRFAAVELRAALLRTLEEARRQGASDPVQVVLEMLAPHDHNHAQP